MYLNHLNALTSFVWCDAFLSQTQSWRGLLVEMSLSQCFTHWGSQGLRDTVPEQAANGTGLGWFEVSGLHVVHIGINSPQPLNPCPSTLEWSDQFIDMAEGRISYPLAKTLYLGSGVWFLPEHMLCKCQALGLVSTIIRTNIAPSLSKPFVWSVSGYTQARIGLTLGSLRKL